MKGNTVPVSCLPLFASPHTPPPASQPNQPTGRTRAGGLRSATATTLVLMRGRGGRSHRFPGRPRGHVLVREGSAGDGVVVHHLPKRVEDFQVGDAVHLEPLHRGRALGCVERDGKPRHVPKVFEHGGFFLVVGDEDDFELEPLRFRLGVKSSERGGELAARGAPARTEVHGHHAPRQPVEPAAAAGAAREKGTAQQVPKERGHGSRRLELNWVRRREGPPLPALALCLFLRIWFHSERVASGGVEVSLPRHRAFKRFCHRAPPRVSRFPHLKLKRGGRRKSVCFFFFWRRPLHCDAALLGLKERDGGKPLRVFRQGGELADGAPGEPVHAVPRAHFELEARVGEQPTLLLRRQTRTKPFGTELGPTLSFAPAFFFVGSGSRAPGEFVLHRFGNVSPRQQHAAVARIHKLHHRCRRASLRCPFTFIRRRSRGGRRSSRCMAVSVCVAVAVVSAFATDTRRC
mmetsp:Transcript_16399/g.30311  ORF Transcript_16399/g.30311 Transcript_16399/m.30311 type:complete len:461 (-) Transcript_16399:283-1665(-)